MEENTKVEGWVGNPADLTSFNSFGVVTLSDGQQVNVQITVRHGISTEKAYEDFKKYVALLDLCATDSAVKFWDGKKGEKPSAEKSSAEQPTEKKRRYDEPIPQGELPEELVEVTVDVFEQDFDYFVVTPELDDKASVKFYKDSLEWPVGASINKWKHKTVQEAIESVVPEINPSQASKHRVAGVQYWKKGAEYIGKNGKKSNYKDLLLVKPIF